MAATLQHHAPTIKVRTEDLILEVHVDTNQDMVISQGDKFAMDVQGNRAFADMGDFMVQVVRVAYSTHGLTRQWTVGVKIL